MNYWKILIVDGFFLSGAIFYLIPLSIFIFIDVFSNVQNSLPWTEGYLSFTPTVLLMSAVGGLLNGIIMIVKEKRGAKSVLP